MASIDSTAQDIDISLPDMEPEIYEFDGDIVHAEVQHPLESWGPDAKDRIKLVVRDWVRTVDGMERGSEKAYVFFPQAMSLSGGRQATLTKFSNNAKNKLGVELQKLSHFLGLQARFQLSPARKGSGDILSIVGKPKTEMPAGLAPYVPKVKDADEPAVEASGAAPTFEMTPEGYDALRKSLGDVRDVKEAKRIATADKTLRTQFPSAYAYFILNAEQVLSNL